MPARRADDHLLVFAEAGCDVSGHSRRRGEIDYDIDVVQTFRSKRASVFVLFATQYLKVVPSGTGDFLHQGSGFSAA
jgi:hypothetical protein